MQLVASGSKRRVLRLIGHKPVFEFAKQLRVLGVPRVGQPVLAAREVASSQLDQRAMGLLGGDEIPLQPGLCVWIRRLIKDQRDFSITAVINHLVEVVGTERYVVHVFTLLGQNLVRPVPRPQSEQFSMAFT